MAEPMAHLIRLKRKYVFVHNGRNKSKHNDGNKKERKLGRGLGEPYNNRLHVLYFKDGRKGRMVHYDEAKKVLRGTSR